MPAYCAPEDVRQALQKEDLDHGYGPEIVATTIRAVSEWLANRTNGHWYDPTASPGDLVSDTARAAERVRLDVPASPHRQRGQRSHGTRLGSGDARYPVTTRGPYARLPLPHPYVQSLTALRVRDRSGDPVDWTAASDKTEGRGEDYYVERPGQQSYGRTYLFVRAAAIGPRYDYDGILSLNYEYGLSADAESWDDVRRGVASLTAAEVVDDDSVLAQIPENTRLVGVDTEYDNLVSMADRLLGPYLTGEL